MSSLEKLFCAISNSQKRQKNILFYPYTKNALLILKILRQEGYIRSFRYCLFSNKNFLEIHLKSVTTIKLQFFFSLLSTSTRLKYFSKKDIRKLASQSGLVILSTPIGILSAKKTLMLGLGGNALLYVC